MCVTKARSGRIPQPENPGMGLDGRRCPRPARPSAALGGLPPPLARPAWLYPGSHRAGCPPERRALRRPPAREARQRRRRRARRVRPAKPTCPVGPSTGVSRVDPALPMRGGFSPILAGLAADVPEARLPVLRYLAFVPDRLGGQTPGRYGSPSEPSPRHRFTGASVAAPITTRLGVTDLGSDVQYAPAVPTLGINGYGR